MKSKPQLKVHIKHLDRGRRKYRKLMGIDTCVVSRLAHLERAEQRKLVAEYDLVIAFATGRELVASLEGARPHVIPLIEMEMHWLEDHCQVFEPTWTIQAEELRKAVDWTHRPKLMEFKKLEWDAAAIAEGNRIWQAMKENGNQLLQNRKCRKKKLGEIEEQLRMDFMQNLLKPAAGTEGFEAEMIRAHLTDWGIPLERVLGVARDGELRKNFHGRPRKIG